ncbi:MAG: type II toxin-antitoxin system RelE/ParE family toxin [Coprobacillus sp.]|nr:type II toxin-antitoxin system RelE/ParE family toxin [Coprobacillus sp.]
MIYSIETSLNALSDLYNIYEYIAVNCLAPLSAASLVHKIVNMISELDMFPARYRLVDDDNIKMKNLHQVSVERYNIYYLIKEEEKVVSIVRILYGGMNASEILNAIPNDDS